MKFLFGFVVIAIGVVIILCGDKQIGKYGFISKWLFDPPYLNEKNKVVGKHLQKLAIAAILIYLGLMLIFNQ